LSLALVSCSVEPDAVQQKLNDIVVIADIPGLNFSMIDASGEPQSWSAGFSDTTARIPLKTKHVLFSGSVGKTYAVAVLMQLVEEGKVDLDRKFADYFPDHEWLNRLPNMDDITVRMLLQHTSGLPRYINVQGVWETLRDEPDKVWTYEDRLQYIFDTEALHPAGEGWAYSDSNYLLIGMLIEKITGKPYYDEVRARLLEPLQLSNTHPSLRRDIPGLPVAYSMLPEFFCMPGVVVEDGKYVMNPQMEWTGGGMASTTADLARWAKAYYTAEVFSDASLQEIVTPNPQAQDGGRGMAYGMGSFIYQTKQGKAYGHTGFVPGFNALFAYFPDRDIAVAVQTNCDYIESRIGLMQVVEAVLALK
jgi:D-alanyl-D-alanine carboxypeptidase